MNWTMVAPLQLQSSNEINITEQLLTRLCQFDYEKHEII